MAANIEQIFQDFILNKIREIEDQNEDTVDTAGAAGDTSRAGEATSKREEREEDEGKEGSCLQRKHKKHKKHKKKKQKKNREKEVKESESESDGGSRRPSRRRTPTELEQGLDSGTSRGHKHTTGKKKKKKKKKKKRKRQKDERKGNSSDSDSDSPLKSQHGEDSSPRRREDLPDIIPKQDTSNKTREDEERRSRSICPSHSCSLGTAATSGSTGPKLQSCSSENKGALDPSSTVEETHMLVETRAPEPVVAGPVRQPEPNRPTEPDRTTETRPTEQDRTTEPRPTEPDQITEPHPKEPDRTMEPRLTEPNRTTDHRLTKLDRTTEPRPLQRRASQSPDAKKRKKRTSRSPERSRERSKRHRSRTPARRRSRSASKSRRRRSRSQSGSRKRRRSRSGSESRRRRSRSRSGSRKRRRSRSRSRSRKRSGSRRRRSRSRRRSSRSAGRRSRRSRSASRGQRRGVLNQRDRWKREPSHSPVLIIRKKRSPTRKHGAATAAVSPPRISDLDKEQLLEIAKANAAAMCAKAGMPIPASLRSSVLPLALPSMAMNAAMASMTAATMTAALSNIGTLSSLLPSIGNKPPAAPATGSMATLEEVKRKVAKQANSISIKEFTDKCQMIVDSKGDLPEAKPHMSDDEDNDKPFGGMSLREAKAISFNINNVRPALRSDAGMAKEFPVSSGSQHRKKEGDTLGAYGEWVPVEKTTDETAGTFRKAAAMIDIATTTTSASTTSAVDLMAAATFPGVVEPPATDSVFPEPPPQPVDISQAVSERIKAQRRLAENPYDVNAICMLSRAQEQVDAWAQSNTVPGLFTGSTGAQVLSSEELSTSGPQAWLKKDQFLRAAPVSGGVGEFLMRKMGWRTGEGLGRNREGTVEPIVIDFKVDRKGLVAEGEKPQKQTGGLVVTKDLMGKHPVSALIELCNKKRIMQPDFVMVHHSGPDHRKNFLFKVTVNGVDYQPQTASPNKKHAKAMAATVALQALGEVSADGPGLYTGPVFTAASTGPLFST